METQFYLILFSFLAWMTDLSIAWSNGNYEGLPFWSQTYAGVITIPLNDAPSSAENVRYSFNSITQVLPETFAHLTKIEILYLDNNQLTSFPNLTAIGTTLKELKLSHNFIRYIAVENLDCLTALTGLYITNNPQLSTFPASQPLGLSLQALELDHCAFKSLPDMKYMKSMMWISVDNNPITKIERDEIVNMMSIGLDGLHLTEFPDFSNIHSGPTPFMALMMRLTPIPSVPVERAALLNTAAVLNFTGTNIEYFPPTCGTGSSTLWLSALGNPLKLCECENAWLKQVVEAGGSVDVDDVDCGGGNMWSTMTLGNLLDACKNTRMDAAMSRSVGTELKQDLFCGFPLHSVIDSSSLQHCWDVCIGTKGCQSFNFKPDIDDASTGKCVIVAPSTGAPPTVADSGDPGWKYYAVNMG